MRRLTSPGRILAITTVLIVLGGTFAAGARTTSAQVPLYSVYGSGLNRFDTVGIYVSGRLCTTLVVDKDGEWAFSIQLSSLCTPVEGGEVTFKLNDVLAVQTATWKSGGGPTDSGYDAEAGIVLTLPGQEPPATPTPTPVPAANTPAAETTVPSGVAPPPPAGGITQVVAGTSDIQALVDAQTFSVESILKWDVATQSFQFFIVGGPTFANSLTTLNATDIVSIKSK